MSLVSKAFSDIVTFSRSSNATRIGPTGRVEYAPHNLLLQSQDFSTTWTNTRSSEVVNAVAAPDGTVTADKLVEDSSASNDHVINQTASVSSSTTYTTSVFLKAGERTWAFINMVDVGISSYRSWFNLSTGQTGTNDSGNSSTITSVGNGWYRCTVTRATTSSQTSVRIEVGLSTGDGVINYTGDGTSGIYLWGAQLSVGPYPLDYTPTTSAAVYGPRFDYDPVTLAARGLLIEEQRTNNLSYSEQFDNAAWTKARSSITANAATSPGGTVTADQSTIDNTNGFHDACYQTFSATSGTSYTFSIFVKKNVGIEAVYFYTDATSPGAIAKFNLTTGAYIGNAPGNGYSAFTSYSSTALSNGWYRIVATVTAASTNPSTFFTIGMSTNTNDTVAQFTGNGTDNFYLWGAQLEAGSFATSYLPTLASSVTRSADVASVNTLSPWFNSVEGSFFVEADAFNTSSAWSTLIEPNLTSNLAGSRFSLGVVSSAVNLYALVSNSVTVNGISSGGAMYANNAVAKTAFAYKLNDYAISGNGAAVATDTSSAVPTIDQVLLGNDNEGRRLNGHLRRIAYFPRRLQNAELQALTA